MLSEMKKLFKYLFYLFLLTAILPAQETQQPTGFVDADQDGVNDRFADANGDGVNDVDGTPYAHPFEFEDKNRDGLNDLWIDADGDGVNDLLNQFQQQSWIDMDGDGLRDEGTGLLRGKSLRAHVLDMNQDGVNDITGMRISNESLGGYRYGQVDEESGLRRQFRESGDDGQGNESSRNSRLQQGEDRAMDIFIDQDGDGIADERGLGRERTRKKSRSE
jgi:hypothetical protein